MLLALAPPGQQTEITGDTISPRHAVTTRGGQLLTKLYNEKEMQDAVKAVAEKQVQQETCGALGNTKGARRFETFIERICELSLRLRDPPAQRACPAVCTAGARLFAKSPHDLPDFRHWETGFGHRAQRHRPPGAGRPGRAAPSYNRNLWNAQPLRNGYVTAAPPSGSWNLEPQISARGTGTPRNRATGAEASLRVGRKDTFPTKPSAILDASIRTPCRARVVGVAAPSSCHLMPQKQQALGCAATAPSPWIPLATHYPPASPQEA